MVEPPAPAAVAVNFIWEYPCKRIPQPSTVASEFTLSLVTEMVGTTDDGTLPVMDFVAVEPTWFPLELSEISLQVIVPLALFVTCCCQLAGNVTLTDVPTLVYVSVCEPSVNVTV